MQKNNASDWIHTRKTAGFVSIDTTKTGLGTRSTEVDKMDKNNPEISVFTSMPNNGYYALVFTDSGVAMSANCRRQDAYEGLLEACAQFLLDCIDDNRPDFSLFTGHELNPDENAQIDKYAELVASVHDSFCEALKSRLAIGSTTKQLEASGLPHIFAKMLATGMEAFPGKFEKAFADDCDEEDEDSSDDNDNLD